MATLKFNTTTKAKASNTATIPIRDGQFLIVTDTMQLMYDHGSNRMILGDIIELATDAERLALASPVEKFYFVAETNVLWRYNNGSWIDMTNSGGSSTPYGYTLLASAWSAGAQTVQIAAVKADSNGVTGIAQSISTAALEACLSATIIISGQANGSITLTANGDVPTVDIPAVLLLFN